MTDEDIELFFKQIEISTPTHFSDCEPYYKDVAEFFDCQSYQVYTNLHFPTKLVRRIAYVFAHRYASIQPHVDRDELYYHQPLVIYSPTLYSASRTLLWANGGITVSDDFVSVFVTDDLVERLLQLESQTDGT